MRIQSQSTGDGRRRLEHILMALSIIGLCGCRADAIAAVSADATSRTIKATTGQEIDVTLGNVGPAMYASPPTISSDAVTYLGVDIVPPYTPAGPNQRFRFMAVSAGQAILMFRRDLGDSQVSVVEDTVLVR